MNTTHRELPALRPDFQLVSPIEGDGAPPSTLHIQRFFLFLRRYWWLPVATLTISLGAAAAYVLASSPAYVSHARMWETVKFRPPEGGVFTEDVQNFLGTQTELLQSETLRDLALQRLKTSAPGAIAAAGGEGKTPRVSVRVTQASKSSVFVLEVFGPDGPYTRAYLNALMDAYLDYKKGIRKMVSGDTLASITEQVQRAERDLNAEQDALTAYERTNNLAILQEEAQVSAAYLARLKTQLSDTELENKLLGAAPYQPDLSGANTNLANGWVNPAMLAGNDASDRSSSDRLHAIQELEILKKQRAELSRFLRPQHPKLVKLNADIERGEQFLQIFQRYGQDQIAAMRQANAVKIQNVEASIDEWEKNVVGANSRIAEAEHLKINVERAQNVYDRMVRLVENVSIGGNLDQETLAILEPASPARRYYAKETNVIGMAIFGGAAVGIGLLLLMMMRDDRLVTFTEVNEQISEDILSQVPEVKSLAENNGSALLEMGDSRHNYAESFRSLRSALLFMQKEGDRPKVVLITSALPHEGKSTIAANLARALALGGSKVALVDADVRKGILHELMGLQREPGLTDALRDSGDLKGIVQSNSIPNLNLVSCGRSSADGCDLFLGAAFDRFLGQLRARFDYVLIDSSPIFATDEAPTLAPKVDGTLFVVRSRFSRGRIVREALEMLYRRNARVLGVVFNQVDASAQSYHYYQYADYYPAPTTNTSRTGEPAQAHASMSEKG